MTRRRLTASLDPGGRRIGSIGWPPHPASRRDSSWRFRESVAGNPRESPRASASVGTKAPARSLPPIPEVGMFCAWVLDDQVCRAIAQARRPGKNALHARWMGCDDTNDVRRRNFGLTSLRGAARRVRQASAYQAAGMMQLLLFLVARSGCGTAATRRSRRRMRMPTATMTQNRGQWRSCRPVTRL